MSEMVEILHIQQGTPEWINLRKKKITATDASIIMGVNPWKNVRQLYEEKKSNNLPSPCNERMQRGIDLEPIARDLFNLNTGWNMKPSIIVKDWMMASLDGRDEDSGTILEIKCPGQKDHLIAQSGKVPDHYYPQLQHQMYVSGVHLMFYFSFDGAEGITVKVKRDDEYIEKMIPEEKKFYECLMNNTPPENCKKDYIEKDDPVWNQYISEWKLVNENIKSLQKQEEDLRSHIIFLTGGLNCKGNGVCISQVERKGSLDYSKIPELKNINLELYRNPSTSSWRITCK